MNKIKIINIVYVYRGCSHVTSAADENDLRVLKTSAVMQRRACRPLIRLRSNRVRYNITIFMLRDYRQFALGYNTLSHRLSIVCPRVDLFFVFYMVFFFFLHCYTVRSLRQQQAHTVGINYCELITRASIAVQIMKIECANFEFPIGFENIPSTFSNTDTIDKSAHFLCSHFPYDQYDRIA